MRPLQDVRWNELLNRYPTASVFHTHAWLEALHRTYGYASEGFTTSPPEAALQNVIVISRVKSWITGSRLVSVAFADACQPLVSGGQELHSLVSAIQEVCREEGHKYVEFRWLNTDLQEMIDGLNPAASYAYHVMNIREDLGTIFRAFHKTCIRNKIRRAEKERLHYEVGSSDEMLREFYRLLILTRQRHGLPPQPFAWFRNLRDCFGGSFRVRIARKDGRPVASILTLQHKQSLVYKYGCSDARFHHLGPMPWLFWRAVQEAKDQSLYEFDLGRSDLTDHGLIAFKNHLGATAAALTNYRYPREAVRASFHGLSLRRSCEYLPSSILRAAGTLLYRHVG
jgi:CelD/BcsL family acetyltransferase involved in cellulose biosynthesis